MTETTQSHDVGAPAIAAIAERLEAVQAAPDRVNLWVQLGHAFKEAGQLEAASRAYGAGMACDGMDIDAPLHLGHLLKRLGRFAAAIDVFSALGRIPYGPRVSTELAGLRLAVQGAAPVTPAAGGATDPQVNRLIAEMDRLIAGAPKAAPAASQAVTRRQGTVRHLLVRLEPEIDVVVEGKHLRATTANPHLHLVLRDREPAELAGQWVELEVGLQSMSGVLTPVLFVAHAERWQSFTAVALHPRSGSTYGAVFQCKGPVVALRVVPMRSPGLFDLYDCHLTRLSAIDLVRKAVDKAGGSALKLLALGSGAPSGGGLLGRLAPLFAEAPLSDYQRWLLNRSAATVSALPKPTDAHISVGWLLPVQDEPLAAVQATLKSLIVQRLDSWQAAIGLGAGLRADVRQWLEAQAKRDDRLTLVGGAQANPGAWLTALAGTLTSDYVGLLKPGDRLDDHALTALAPAAGAAVIYGDDDRVDAAGQRSDPRFKPDWNADYFRCYDYVGRAALLARAPLLAAGGFAGDAGIEVYGAILRLAGEGREVAHVAEPLWHLGAGDAGPVAPIALVAADVKRRGSALTVKPGLTPDTARLVWPLPAQPPRVTVIMPTRDRLDLTERAVTTLLASTEYPDIELLIVDNGSRDAAALAYLDRLDREGRARILRDDGDFNYSRLNNRAAARASGPVLALLNNDVEVIEGDWLREMVGPALDPAIGAVGAKLLYGNRHVQHAGIVGGVGTVAAHGHKFAAEQDPGYMRRLVVQQEVIAVTAACLVVEREKYLAVGGLDEDNLTVAFNDVDLCLKLAARGWRTLFTPFARMIHHESMTRGLDNDGERQARFLREAAFMTEKWGRTLLEDRFYSPHLTRQFEDFSIGG